MNPRRIFAGAAILVLALTAPARAGAGDLADLVPARTLAYLELHDPPSLARELHALCKGSYLQNPAALMADTARRGKKQNDEALLLAWMGSPEFIDEVGDWQGGCMALTGFWNPDDPGPEVVAVLRTGKGRMFPLALRLLLLEEGDVRCIARVEGVPILQIGNGEKRKRPQVARRATLPLRQLARLARRPRAPLTYPVARLEDMPVEEPDEKPEFGCFLSLMPGAVAVATTPEALADTVRRIKGKPSSPALTTAPAFRAAAALRNRPGLFAWCDPPRLARWFNDDLRRQLLCKQDEVRHRPLAKGEKRDPAKLRAELREVEAQHGRDTQEWTFFQALANPAGMHYAAAGCYLHRGELACFADVRMRQNESSPLLELIPQEKLAPELFRAVPGDAFGLFALPLPDGAGTITRLLKLADTYATAADEKASLPSRELRELEKTLKLRFGRDVLARIRSAGVAVQLVQQADRTAEPYPLIVVEATNEADARVLESLPPRLFGGGGKSAEPKRVTIDGQVIHSLGEAAASEKLEGPPCHYGRRGNILVFGWHRDSVAVALRDSDREKDLLNLPRGRAAVEAEGPVGAMGLVSCRQVLGHLAQVGSEHDNQGPGDLRVLRYLREMSAPMATMPPTTFVVKRRPDGLRAEFRQAELPAVSATVVDIALTWLLDEEAGGALFKQRWQMAAPPPQMVVPAAPAMPAVPVPAPPAADTH